MRVSRYHRQAGGIFARTLPEYFRDLFALWDRHDQAADSGGAGSTLSMRRNQNRRKRRDDFARLVRNWRSWLYRIARRESFGEQFAPRRFGRGAPRVRSDDVGTTSVAHNAANFIAGVAIRRCAGCR